MATSPSESCTETNRSILDWKTLIKAKLTPPNETRQSSDFRNLVVSAPRDVKRNLNFEFDKVEEKIEKSVMEISTNKFPETTQLDPESSCFIPIDNAGPRSFYSTDFGESINSNMLLQCKAKDRLEGWECAPILSPVEAKEDSSELFKGRLFERATKDSNYDDDRMKQLENNASHSAAQLWGESSSELWESKHNFAWEFSAQPSQKLDAQRRITVNAWDIQNKGNWNNDNLNSFSISKSWSNMPNTDWGSQALRNTSQDSFLTKGSVEPIPLPEKKASTVEETSDMRTGNIKDLWSDCNDNTISVECLRQNYNNEECESREPFSKDNSEERLCESFRSLGLEHLWRDPFSESAPAPPFKESINTQNFGAALIKQQSSEDFQRELLFSSSELYGMKSDNVEDEVDSKILSSRMPSGPTGPYVDLKPTEGSGFSTVVPHKTTDVEQELLLVNTQGIRIPNSEQEEENLLTSPRTHFRPIRQDSNGSTQEDGKGNDENQACGNAADGLQDPDLVFQRTESGTLFLESDLLEGSPKKYMVYRDSTIKPIEKVKEITYFPKEEQQQQGSLSGSTTSLIPKFKIINNEKFCQTEEGSTSARLGEAIDRELLSLKIFNSFTKNKEDQPPSSLESIWKPEQEKTLKMLWDQKPEPKVLATQKEAWEIADSPPPTVSLPKWSTNDLNAAHWDKKNFMDESRASNQNELHANPETRSMAANTTNATSTTSFSKADESFSKIKFIWHSSVVKSPHKGSKESVVKNDKENVSPSLTYSTSFSNDAKAGGILDVAKTSTLNATANPWKADTVLRKSTANISNER